MAELLQRQFSLPILRVRLDTTATVPAARCTMAAHERGERIVLGEAAWPLPEFGFPRGELAGDQRLDVPEALAAWAAAFVRPGAELEGIPVLWLHLVKPYGHLGGVPWERVLVPAVGRPVLRLPDVLPAPQTSTRTLEVAICATGAAAEGPPPAVRHLEEVARAIAGAAAHRKLALHVFADREAEGVVARVAAQLPGVHVVDHVARGWSERAGGSSASSRAGAARGHGAGGNPWLSAMRDALRGRGIDVVHFVCHGHHTGFGGALLFAADPRGARGDWPSSASAAELGALMTDLGAVDAVFTAPDRNYSEAGLLELADALGVDRTGTTLVHDAALDPGAGALEAAYRVLLGAATVPPASPALAWVVQPRLVEPEATEEVLVPRTRAVPRAVAAGPGTRAAYEAGEPVPGWLAAAERFVEQRGAELARFHDRAANLDTTPEEVSYYAGVEKALERVRDLVDAHAAGGAPPPEAAP